MCLSLFVSFLSFCFGFIDRYVESESQRVSLENKISKLQADQALWQDIFLKNAELEISLKKEKEWRSQLQASTETTSENLT